MNPPRWETPTADAVREELLRRVGDGIPEASPSPGRRAAVRIGIAVVIALALIVPASILAFRLGARTPPAGGGTTLRVATDASYTYDPMGDHAGVTGTLHASRDGDRACFWLTTTTVSPVFGPGPYSFVFPSGYSASGDLALLDADGQEVADPGDEVAVSTLPRRLASSPASCQGVALGALHVERTTIPSTTPSVSTTGCEPNSAEMPRSAVSASVSDVDGDSRPDRYWAVLTTGDMEFGITTASGATIVGRQAFAGGGSRSFVVGRLANGVVVAITSEGRDSPVYTFSGCAFHQLQGKDLAPGSADSSPFTLYSADGGGSGGCYDGRLAFVRFDDLAGDRQQAVARFVDVSSDGLRATTTTESSAVSKPFPSSDSATYGRYAGISCGSSTVLFPVARGD